MQEKSGQHDDLLSLDFFSTLFQSSQARIILRVQKTGYDVSLKENPGVLERLLFA